jgi:signal transduction histidine kinase
MSPAMSAPVDQPRYAKLTASVALATCGEKRPGAAAGATALRSRRRGTPYGAQEVAYSALLALVGIGSVAFHGPQPRGAEVQRIAAPVQFRHQPGQVVGREAGLGDDGHRRIRHQAERGEARGDARRFAVILTDVTRDKHATAQQLEDERTSSILLLAAGVAHELGNPLNSLTIHLQLIARKLKKLKASKDTESLVESVDVCRAEVARLDGIIAHFLEAIRPQPPDLAELDLAEVLAEVLRFQQREFADRRIAVEVEASGDLPVVMADRNQLKQVFFNLAKNALDAMEPGGRLKIRARADDDSVFLLFGDSGSGIKQEDLVRVFQPYHTTKPGGHGLGLMIVQRILREHGGQVGIESKEGVGTVVTLQFPRKDRRVRMLGGGAPPTW